MSCDELCELGEFEHGLKLCGGNGAAVFFCFFFVSCLIFSSISLSMISGFGRDDTVTETSGELPFGKLN